MIHNVIASDVTTDAVVFRNCTRKELYVVFIGGAIVWIPICTIISASLTGSAMLGAGVALALIVIGGYCMSVVLGQWKKNAPEGQYAQKIELFLHERNLKKFYFFHYNGEMSIGRTKQIVFVREAK